MTARRLPLALLAGAALAAPWLPAGAVTFSLSRDFSLTINLNRNPVEV